MKKEILERISTIGQTLLFNTICSFSVMLLLFTFFSMMGTSIGPFLLDYFFIIFVSLMIIFSVESIVVEKASLLMTPLIWSLVILNVLGSMVWVKHNIDNIISHQTMEYIYLGYGGIMFVAFIGFMIYISLGFVKSVIKKTKWLIKPFRKNKL